MTPPLGFIAVLASLLWMLVASIVLLRAPPAARRGYFPRKNPIGESVDGVRPS